MIWFRKVGAPARQEHNLIRFQRDNQSEFKLTHFLLWLHSFLTCLYRSCQAQNSREKGKTGKRSKSLTQSMAVDFIS